MQSLAEGSVRGHGGRLKGHFDCSRNGSTQSQKKLACFAGVERPAPNEYTQSAQLPLEVGLRK